MDRLISLLTGFSAGIVFLGLIMGDTVSVVCGALAWVLVSFMDEGDSMIDTLVDEALRD